MDITRLTEHNPWWKAEGGIDQDPQMKEFQRSSLKWRPELMRWFDWDQDRIYTIWGPRQVGKTTLMKLMIQDLLAKGVSPFSIMYTSCDLIKGHDELYSTMDSFLDFSKRRAGGGRRYLFVDEVPSVRGWERAIKALADMGKLKDATVLLTGSHCLDIKHSAERLPGRRGEDRSNIMFPPMRFREFMETCYPRVMREMSQRGFREVEGQGEALFRLSRGEMEPSTMDAMHLYSKEIFAGFEDYLVSGGIVRPMEQMRRKGSIDGSVYELYVSSLLGDMARWRHSERATRQVLSSVIRKMTTRISLSSLAKENEIGSHVTVASYLEALEDSFILHTLFGMEMDDASPNFARERKVYVRDPFIFHALRAWTSGRSDYFEMSREALQEGPLKGSMVEMVVANHLHWLAYDLARSDVFSPHERLMYWRKKGGGKEVDFVLKHDGQLHPLEVKYRTGADKGHLEGLHSFGHGILVTKDATWTHRTYSALPAAYLLLLV